MAGFYASMISLKLLLLDWYLRSKKGLPDILHLRTISADIRLLNCGNLYSIKSFNKYSLRTNKHSDASKYHIYHVVPDVLVFIP